MIVTRKRRPAGRRRPETRRQASITATRPSWALLVVLSVLAAAPLALAACGSGSAGGGGSTGRPSLEGTSWRLTGWSVSSLDSADFTITAEFKDGRIGGTSAVNTYGGPYQAGEDGSFSVGQLVSTMMAGPEPDMRAESTYLELLAAAASYGGDGETLTLYDEGGNESLVFATVAK